MPLSVRIFAIYAMSTSWPFCSCGGSASPSRATNRKPHRRHSHRTCLLECGRPTTTLDAGNFVLWTHMCPRMTLACADMYSHVSSRTACKHFHKHPRMYAHVSTHVSGYLRHSMADPVSIHVCGHLRHSMADCMCATPSTPVNIN